MKILTDKQIENLKEQTKKEVLTKIKEEFINADTTESFCEFMFNYLFKENDL